MLISLALKTVDYEKLLYFVIWVPIEILPLGVIDILTLSIKSCKAEWGTEWEGIKESEYLMTSIYGWILTAKKQQEVKKKQ